jgi:hypothetical protein
MQALGLVWGNADSAVGNLKEIRTEIKEPTHYGACLLLEAWRTKERRGGFVVGRDVPSRELACVLRNLALYEPVEHDNDFRVRLAGTAFMRRFGRDITGLNLSRVYDPAKFDSQRRILDSVIATRTPHTTDVKVTRDGRAVLRFEVLRLCVLSPDRTKSWVMSGLFYSDWM